MRDAHDDDEWYTLFNLITKNICVFLFDVSTMPLLHIQ
jgi:hypothetical protein